MPRTGPQAICLVTSGSRGRKLLFYDKGRPCKDCVSDVLSELPARTLSEILAPNRLMVNHTFELNVDQWKFVGHPFSVQNESFDKFNITFIIEACSKTETVREYDHLSDLLGSAVVHEEEKCGFLQTEVKVLLQCLEDMDIADPSNVSLLRASSLAKSLHDVLCCLQEGQSQLTVKINQWTEVSTLVQLDSEETETRKAKTSVRSYSALLLLESLENIMASLPASCNPAMHRLLNTLSPMMNLQDVSLDADIPLSQVLQFSSHLVHWGKAMTIYPLSESNVYIASPTAETRVRSSLAERFSAELPGLSLPQVLSTLELPRQMAELKATYADALAAKNAVFLLLDTMQKTRQMVVWLLRHRQITQLHTYVYIVPSLSSPPTGAISPTSPSNGHNLNTSHHDSHGEYSDEDIEQSLQDEMRQHLSVQEYQCVMHTTAATDYDDLALFIRLCKYFRGNQHLEEIMLKENIQRSQLLTLIDKFSEILVTCTLPEHSKTV